MDSSIYIFVELNYNNFVNDTKRYTPYDKRRDKSNAFDIVNEVLLDFIEKEKYKKLNYDPSTMCMYIRRSLYLNCKFSGAPHLKKMGIIKEYIPWRDKEISTINEDKLFDEEDNLFLKNVNEYDLIINDRARWKNIFGEDHLYYWKIWKMYREGMSTRDIGDKFKFSHVKIFYGLKFVIDKLKDEINRGIITN